MDSEATQNVHFVAATLADGASASVTTNGVMVARKILCRVAFPSFKRIGRGDS